MELLKYNPIIDELYRPSIKMNHIDYFNRALKFAQTNYHDHLVKVSKLDPRSITSTHFFEEYVGALLSTKEDIYKLSNYCAKLFKFLHPYNGSFWDLNNFPSKEKMRDLLEEFYLDEKQFEDIHATAYIVNQGIKLFGWDKYRNNFLNSPGKLLALPGLGLSGANQLSYNIGGAYSPDDNCKLYNLAISLGFDDAKALLMAIQKNFSMSWRTIGTVLWYSAVTFDTVDIVSAD